jgi:hypothetical protein
MWRGEHQSAKNSFAHHVNLFSVFAGQLVIFPWQNISQDYTHGYFFHYTIIDKNRVLSVELKVAILPLRYLFAIIHCDLVCKY